MDSITDERIKELELVSNFIGKEWIKNKLDWMDEEMDLCNYEDVHFDTNWDWLMPVLDKIADISINNSGSIAYWFSYTLRNCFCTIEKEFADGKKMWITKHECKTTIEAAWLSVYLFIKWYNENPTSL